MRFFAECNEPKVGRIVREVKDFTRGMEHTIEIHEKLLQVSNFLEITDSIESLQALLDPHVHIVEVDNVGLIALDQIVRGFAGRIHATFWDRRLRGRENLCRSVVNRFILQYGLKGVYCQSESPMIWRFLERVGFEFFVEEGYLRQYEYLVNHDYLHRANRFQGGH